MVELLGTFLVTYFIAMIFCGIPVFYQEVAIGQYLGVGGMSLIGQLAPIMKGNIVLIDGIQYQQLSIMKRTGVGFATMTIVFFINIYYCIIIAWTLFYLFASFSAFPGLPWQSCSKQQHLYDCL